MKLRFLTLVMLCMVVSLTFLQNSYADSNKNILKEMEVVKKQQAIQDKKLDKILKILETNRKEHKDKMEEYNKLMKEYKEGMKAYNDKMTTYEGSVKTYNDKMSEYEDNVKGHKTRVDEYENRVDDYNDRMNKK